ncbi:hypothetical protein IRJ41_019443, partial [Triplophysa rosa]
VLAPTRELAQQLCDLCIRSELNCQDLYSTWQLMGRTKTHLPSIKMFGMDEAVVSRTKITQKLATDAQEWKMGTDQSGCDIHLHLLCGVLVD